MRRRLKPLLLVIMAGCQRPTKPPRPPALIEFAGRPDSARMLQVENSLGPAVESVVAYANGGLRRGLCGSKPFSKPRELLLITAEHCLGCRTVGYALRHLVKDSISKGLVVGIPETDSQAVCSFLRAERVQPSTVVFGLPRPLLTDTLFHRIAMYVRVGDGGQITHKRAGVDVLQLLEGEGRIAGAVPGSSSP